MSDSSTIYSTTADTINSVGDWAMGSKASLWLYKQRDATIKSQKRYYKGDANKNGKRDTAEASNWVKVKLDPNKLHKNAAGVVDATEHDSLRVGDTNKNGFQDTGETWGTDPVTGEKYEYEWDKGNMFTDAWDFLERGFVSVVAWSSPTFLKEIKASLGGKTIMNMGTKDYGQGRGLVTTDSYAVSGGINLNGPQVPGNKDEFYPGWMEGLGLPASWRGTVAFSGDLKQYGYGGYDSDISIIGNFSINPPIDPTDPDDPTKEIGSWDEAMPRFRNFTTMPWFEGESFADGFGNTLHSVMRTLSRWPSYVDGKLERTNPGGFFAAAGKAIGRTILIPFKLFTTELPNSCGGFIVASDFEKHVRKDEASYYSPSSTYNSLALGIKWSGQWMPMGKKIMAYTGGTHKWGWEAYREGYPFNCTIDTADLIIQIPLGGHDWRLDNVDANINAKFSSGIKAVEQHYTGTQSSYQINPVTQEMTPVGLFGTGRSDMFNRGISNDEVSLDVTVPLWFLGKTVFEIHANTSREDLRRDKYEYTPIPTVTLFDSVTISHTIIENPSMLTKLNTWQDERESRWALSLTPGTASYLWGGGSALFGDKPIKYRYTGLDCSIIWSTRTWKELDEKRNPTILKHDFLLGVIFSFPWGVTNENHRDKKHPEVQ